MGRLTVHRDFGSPVDNDGPAVETAGVARQVPAHAVARAVLGIALDRARQALRDRLNRVGQVRN
jgi:hypothetical protein